MRKWLLYVLFLLVAIISFSAMFSTSSQYHITDSDVTVCSNSHNSANQYQVNASVRLFAWNGQLYFFPCGPNAKKQFYGELCVFEDKTVKSILDANWVYAVENGFIYYEEPNDTSKQSTKLKCYDIEAAKSIEVAVVDDLWANDAFIDETGVCYIPKDFRLSAYYVLKDGEIREQTKIPNQYSVGNKWFIIENGDLVCYHESGEKEVLINSVGIGKLSIVPCNSGLLVMNNGATDLLYFISGDNGQISELFTFEGFSTESAVNVHGEWVYVSFSRYKSLEGCSISKFENDTMEGTYRINLSDRTAEKLSDTIYDGLYIFDDTGIYACKAGRIYKLDFNGDVIMTLLA